MQLLEMNIPMVVALNMMDEVRGNGGYIDINLMESMLGVPVIPISAAKNVMQLLWEKAKYFLQKAFYLLLNLYFILKISQSRKYVFCFFYHN